MLMMLALGGPSPEGESQLMLMMLALGARPLEGESQLMLMMLAFLSPGGGSQLMS